MDLKETKKWCEALPVNAEVRPIMLELIAELETTKEMVQTYEEEIECWQASFCLLKENYPKIFDEIWEKTS